MRIFAHKPLKKLMYASLAQAGVCADACHHVTESVTQTSLRGIDSHGITLFPHYHAMVLSGRINGNPSFNHERRSASIAAFDANHGFGHHAGSDAMLLAVDIAKETGIGAVSVKNSTHFGAAAYYAFMAAEHNFMGLAFTNAPSGVLAYNSSTSFFGTNPVCCVAPMLDEGPFCLDMATASFSINRLGNHKRLNQPIDPGLVFDAYGKMTTDPQAARFVGPSGGYKGYGLGMMVDIFCGMFASSPMGKELQPMYKDFSAKRYLSHFFVAIDISRFLDVTEFKTRLQNLAATIRQLPKADEDTPVMIPGDPEKKCFSERSVSGIPVDEPMYQKFLAIDAAYASALM